MKRNLEKFQFDIFRAHIAGLIGRRIFEVLGKTVPLINGLDPAGLFFNHSSKSRLREKDAAHVCVIHTSLWGYMRPLGHADFYFNGGIFQPGTFGKFIGYSHNQSKNFYAQLVRNPTCFKGKPYSSNSDDRIRACGDTAARGSFSVKTGHQSNA